ncbi:MAG: hypothetical protein ACUVX8_01555 [Candidatus Zipacnadales bacterium]
MKTLSPHHLAVVALISLSSRTQAAGIAILGSCQATVGPQWLLQERHGPRALTYVSDPSAVLLNITGMSSQLAGWRVEIRRADMDWPRGMRLWVRRTGDGMGSGRVWGPSRFTEITPTGVLLCIGQGDRIGIPLQFRITGLSFDIPVGTHTTSIAYGLIIIGE